MLTCSCSSASLNHADNAIVYRLDYENPEEYASIMSDEETIQLRELLKNEAGWLDAELCSCIDEELYLFDVMLDGNII